MKHITTISLFFLCIFSLTSCGGGSSSSSGSDAAESAPENTFIEPPTDLDSVTNENEGDTTSDGTSPSLTSDYEAEIFAKINDLRSSEGLPALILDNAISVIALSHNEYMATEGVLSHDGHQERANIIFALEYNLVGENVADIFGFSASEVTDVLTTGWNESPGHRKTLLGDFTHTGISVYVDPNGTKIYATQLFARENN